MMNFYELLGVNRTADRDEIKEKYQRLIRQFHPDKRELNDSQHFVLVDKAWKVLSDEKARRQYDAELMAKEIENEICIQETVNYSSLIESEDILSHPCRCGDNFTVEKSQMDDLKFNNLIIGCNSCSLYIKIIN